MTHDKIPPPPLLAFMTLPSLTPTSSLCPLPCPRTKLPAASFNGVPSAQHALMRAPEAKELGQEELCLQNWRQSVCLEPKK